MLLVRVTVRAESGGRRCTGPGPAEHEHAGACPFRVTGSVTVTVLQRFCFPAAHAEAANEEQQ
jgi:hypothetical protein